MTAFCRLPKLARVEGEGALYIRASGNKVEEARLDIYVPRFFEAFLRGRAYTEPPDITARICGICPVAYQTSAYLAIEEACGVTVDGPIADLRRLLYCGEWIESHSLHIYLLHAPDFLGYSSGIEMATERRDIVERGLGMKKAGNAILEAVGGRAIHPINVRIGGFYRAPSPAELAALTDPLGRALEDALATVRWVAGFDFPDHMCEADMLALSAPGTYPIERGTVATRSGLAFPASAWEDHVIEEHVPHSTALHAHLAGGRRYLTGPLARDASAHSGCLRWPARPPATPGWARPTTTRSAASSCGPWRWSTRSRRRCGSSPPTNRRIAPPWTCRRGTASDAGRRRRPGAPCGTGTRSARTASSPRPASCPPHRRTRRRSRPTCAPSWKPGSTSKTTSSPASASRPSATTTRASPARLTS